MGFTFCCMSTVCKVADSKPDVKMPYVKSEAYCINSFCQDLLATSRMLNLPSIVWTVQKLVEGVPILAATPTCRSVRRSPLDGDGAGAWCSLRAQTWPNVSCAKIHSRERLPLHNMAFMIDLCLDVASVIDSPLNFSKGYVIQPLD